MLKPLTKSSYKITKISILRMNFKQKDNLALESKFHQIAMKYTKADHICFCLKNEGTG